MELTEARTIIRTLAQGVDPVTGEEFAADSPYNHPKVIRALFTVYDHERSPKARMGADERRQRNLERGLPRNAGLPWIDDDRARVASGFKDGHTLDQLATALERSRAAIHAELIRQGLIEPSA